MNDAYDWLAHNHSEFESFLYNFTDAVEQEAWVAASELFKQLIAALKAHMAMEEEVLYPAYESYQDLPQEPIIMLRAEHDNIVALLRDMAKVIVNRDSEHALRSVQPLERALISHHEKEEDIFLPLAGHILLSQKDDIIRQLQDFDTSTAQRKWDL
jgi:iron-sulfur cluster repair protein YtfE (RIC family)